MGKLKPFYSTASIVLLTLLSLWLGWQWVCFVVNLADEHAVFFTGVCLVLTAAIVRKS